MGSELRIECQRRDAIPPFSFKEKLSLDVALIIFSNLSARDLCRVSLVSKDCKSLANSDFLWRNLSGRIFCRTPKMGENKLTREWYREHKEIFLFKKNNSALYDKLSNKYKIQIEELVNDMDEEDLHLLNISLMNEADSENILALYDKLSEEYKTRITEAMKDLDSKDFPKHLIMYARGFIEGYATTVKGSSPRQS
jgi:hypothetical protein